MTDSFEWRKKKHSSIWWLRDPKNMFATSVGLVSPSQIEPLWHVAVWIPREEVLVKLPRDTPMDDVLGTAKVLILLTLKQRGLV